MKRIRKNVLEYRGRTIYRSPLSGRYTVMMPDGLRVWRVLPTLESVVEWLR